MLIANGMGHYNGVKESYAAKRFVIFHHIPIGEGQWGHVT